MTGKPGRIAEKPVASAATTDWTSFHQEFDTAAGDDWLERMRFRLAGTGTAWLSDLSLTEARSTKAPSRVPESCFAMPWPAGGYSTSVAAWEYWNEMNPGLPTDRFYSALGKYLAQADN